MKLPFTILLSAAVAAVLPGFVSAEAEVSSRVAAGIHAVYPA